MVLHNNYLTHLSDGTKTGHTKRNDLGTRITSGFWHFLIISFVILFSGCITDRGSLENEVKQIMVETIREKGHNLTITKFSLVHQGGNNYEGLAEGTIDGEKIQLDVYVVYDGINVKAEWQPTAAYIQEENNRIVEEQQREYNKMMKEYQKQQDEILQEIEKYEQEFENQRITNELNEYYMY